MLGWDCIPVQVSSHALFDVVTEKFDLASNVSLESETFPATDEHDLEWADSVQSQRHGCAAPNGVGADVFWPEAKDVGSESMDNISQLLDDVSRLYSRHSGAGLTSRRDSHGVDWSVTVHTWVRIKALHNSSPSLDCTER